MSNKMYKEIAAFMKMPLLELVQKADTVRRDRGFEKMDICTIFNAKSGKCTEDCKFCAQSSYHKTDISRYPLKSVEEIFKAAFEAYQNGAQSFGIVCSGNKPTEKEFGVICDATEKISREIGIKVCASLGAISREELKQLKQSGLSKYHHNIETSPRFYPEIVTTHSFDERLRTINAASKAGLDVCCGVLIGMGETMDDRIEMALILKELPVVSVPVNILVPIKGTPLENKEAPSCDEIIRTIAIFRILIQDKSIKIAAGRETVLKDFQSLGFMAGATGMLIGGYLTVKGRQIEEDRRLIKEIESVWDSS